jgi:hypothetical protein
MSWFWIVFALVMFLGLMEQLGKSNKTAGKAAWIVVWSLLAIAALLILRQID